MKKKVIKFIISVIGLTLSLCSNTLSQTTVNFEPPNTKLIQRAFLKMDSIESKCLSHVNQLNQESKVRPVIVEAMITSFKNVRVYGKLNSNLTITDKSFDDPDAIRSFRKSFDPVFRRLKFDFVQLIGKEFETTIHFVYN